MWKKKKIKWIVSDWFALEHQKQIKKMLRCEYDEM